MPNEFVCQEHVRWHDIDLVGIMRYDAYFRFVTYGEEELFRSIDEPVGSVQQSNNLWLPRKHVTIEYFSPCALDELLTIVVWLSRIGQSSLVFEFDLLNEHRVQKKAHIQMVLVCVNAGGFTKRPLPDDLRAKLLKFVR